MSLKSIRYRIEEVACKFLAFAVPRLPRRACVVLGNALGGIVFALDSRGRKVSLENIECVFGDKYDPAERVRIARASYRNFIRTMLDLFWAQNFTAENFRKWIKLENYEPVKERMRREKCGGIFICLHHGNWEWTSLSAPFEQCELMSVAESFKNPRLEAIFSHLRQHTGSSIIPQENSVIRLLKRVKRGGMSGMLIDLNLRPSQASTIIEAYGPNGLLMCVPLLHGVLAQRGDALLIPVETEPMEDGTCRLRVHEPIEHEPGASLTQVAQLCWDRMEPMIRARPESYLWMYKHFRFRPKDASRPYPSYSNESGKFEKLRRALP